MRLTILKWKKSAWKSVQNLHRIHEEFSIFGAEFWQLYSTVNFPCTLVQF